MTLRPVLSSLPAYVPGRTVPGAIKLASNESAYPPLPHVLQRIADAAANANRYPDNTSSELAGALAARYGVPADQVAVGCGSVSLCTQLVQAVADADDEVVYAWRSFEAYPIITAVAGASAVQVPLTAGHVHDLDEMAARITGKTRLLFVCNPNNPTGTAVGRDALVRFLRAVPADVVVALDEAYREFVADPDVPDGLTLLPEFPNVVVLRTFSKAYGLAGLRVGYAITADPVLATALRQTQVPFAVTSVAQAAALASLEPAAEEQMAQRVDEVRRERVRVRDALRDLGHDVPASEANFVWLPLGERTVEWAARCEDHGVIVRAFASSGVRVTISSPAENDRLLAAAADLG
ncbi:histidinol-phosphate aminotransferase [Jatrophihabitans endophyticus]|uniref:Aromatic amino acid aminotransferase n=1 Tax=Jatrophihabitans endophyticus TaxID=1206085 RepID=A0A1M5I0J7_9ACTN|nr:histidinol-phosphate transaminase [Jatrophihabitans endophyticus]SHG21856.1 histidinol-phosphate aminotransferase [Jatrophihabitans endophyticus]